MAGRETCSVARVNVFNQRNLISRLVFLFLSHSLTPVAVVHSFLESGQPLSYEWPGASVGLKQPTTANRRHIFVVEKKMADSRRIFTGFLRPAGGPRWTTIGAHRFGFHHWHFCWLRLAGTFNLVEPTITRGDSAVWRLNHHQQIAASASAKPPILLLPSIGIKAPITV
jgi:hypothetical protein